MLPLLWPRIACRVSSDAPAARRRRPTVCRKSCTCSVRNPRCRLSEPLLILGDCTLASVEPGRVVDAAKPIAAEADYCGGVPAPPAPAARACDRVQRADA